MLLLYHNTRVALDMDMFITSFSDYSLIFVDFDERKYKTEEINAEIIDWDLKLTSCFKV